MSPIPPIVFAVLAGDLELVKERIRAGASLDHADQRHSTALNLALMRDQKDIAEVLLASGADPNGPDLEGRRPRDCAFSPDLKALLIRFGVKDLVADEWDITYRFVYIGQQDRSEIDVLRSIEISLKEAEMAHGAIRPHGKGGFLVRLTGRMGRHEALIDQLAAEDIRPAF